jgi:cytochrome c5
MPRILAIALGFALVASLAAAGCASRASDTRNAPPAPGSLVPMQESAFPQTSGHERAEQACQLCHSPSLVTQQAKDSTAWEKTLGTMIKWGAPVDSTGRDSLRAYLVREFGPRETH